MLQWAGKGREIGATAVLMCRIRKKFLRLEAAGKKIGRDAATNLHGVEGQLSDFTRKER